MILDEERTHFESHKAELLAMARNQFVLIKGSELAGVFQDAETAYAEGLRRFGLDGFLVRQVLEGSGREAVSSLLASGVLQDWICAVGIVNPGADPALIGHDSAFPAMLKFLPVGFVGLMVGGLIAANSSTIRHMSRRRPRCGSPSVVEYTGTSRPVWSRSSSSDSTTS